VILPTPGHSPGHQSLLVRLEERSVPLVGDAACLSRNIEMGVLPAIVWSPTRWWSWELLKQVRSDTGADLIFTNDPEWQARTRVAPVDWYE
jgi:glyoxylase-like metal-dependent hydrolase (beta-lactamase superfamily II)